MEYKKYEMITISLERYEGLKENIKKLEQDLEGFEEIINCIQVLDENGTKKIFLKEDEPKIIEVNVQEILNILGYLDYKNMKVEIIGIDD